MSSGNEELQLSAEAVMRLLEATSQVQRRHQFFSWIQGHLNGLLPHAVLVCGAYQRSRRRLHFDIFNSVVLSPLVLAELGDEGSELIRGSVEAWVQQQGRAVVLDAAGLIALPERREAMLAAGLRTLLAHGVARPQRPAEVESFFIFGGPGYRIQQRDLSCLELLLPLLHSTYLRVQATELDMGVRRSVPKPAAPLTIAQPLTDRERQILGGVREGKSNAEIGLKLGISALTVKNHVQNILRKLGAVNRAQAVARAGTAGDMSVAAPADRPAATDATRRRQPCTE